jgi:anti-sigma factor RsiW
MNCEEMRELKHAYLDGELDLVRSVEIEKHLKNCDACTRVYDKARALKASIHTADLRYHAPSGLQGRIRAAVRDEAGIRETPAQSFAWPWWKWGFSVTGAALLACVVAVMVLNGSADDRLAREVAASHIRSLQAGHLTDVASTDQHTVKPWFDGRLDFAPPVVDLADQGFPLTGGRLDYLENRPVAALVYQRQKHVINLFVWPSPGGVAAAEQTFVRNGYNLVHWSAAGMTFWAVSDLNQGELRNFEQEIKNRAAPPH